MGWQDDFAFVDDAKRRGYVGSAQSYRPPVFRPTAGSGYSPWAVSSSSAPSWTEFATRQLPQAVGQPLAPGTTAADIRTSRPRAGAPVASAPERVNVNLYPGTSSVARVPRDTHGDLLGSIGEGIGNVLNAVNPFNAIPWLMERVDAASGSLADELERHTQDAGPGGFLASVGAGALRGIDTPFHAFGQAVSVAGDAIEPVLNALPSWYRDTQLNDRAKVYAAMVTGQELDPWSAATLSGNLLPLSTPGANTEYQQYLLFHKQLVDSIDPGGRRSLQDRINILLDSMDLPESVKAQLRRNPKADVGKLLDAAPEGRQFSYRPGVEGFVSNLGYPLLFYLSAAKGIGTTAGKFRLGPGVGYGDLGTAVRAAPRTTFAATGIKVASDLTTGAARLQGLALKSGVTVAGLTLAADVAARYAGDQGLIDWFDKLNRTAVISDKPSVQVVTSFTVNPFEALGLAKRGVVRLASGVGDVTIGRVLGTRFTRYYTHSTLLAEQVRRMYRLGSIPEAERFIEEKLGGRGEAFDQVVGLGLQTAIGRLPEGERAALAALPSIDRIQTGLKMHGGEVMRLLEKEPDLLAERWYDEFWLDRQMPGAFSSDVAALIARDYRAAVSRTYQARQRLSAVIGRADYIPPRGIDVAREWLNANVAADGSIALRGVGGFQDLQRQLPALSRYSQGLIAPGVDRLPRSAVETMLERASQDYGGLVKRNPVRAGTATDPILLPNASPRDYATALGTNDQTVKEWMDFSFSADTPIDGLRAFLVEKVGLEPQTVADLPRNDAYQKASDYIEQTTAPWLAMGEKVIAARRQIGGVRDELARLRGLPQGARDSTYSDRVVRLERQLGQLNDLVHYATDPAVPFSDWVRMGKRATRGAVSSAHLEEMALRREEALDALDRLANLETTEVVTVAQSVSNATPWHELVRDTPINHVTAWAGGATPMSAAFRRRFAEYLQTAEEGGTGRMSRGQMNAAAYGLLVDMGDQEAWALFRRHPQAMARMTRSQQRIARAANGGTGIDEYSTNYSVQREGMNRTDAFLEDLVAARDAREEILQGRSEYNVGRTAGMKGGRLDWWDRALIADPKSPVYDAEFVAMTHPHNIAKVADILDRPELFAGLENVVANDPVMMLTLQNALDPEYPLRLAGSSAHEILTQPENAPLLREMLVPEGFERPAAGPIAATPLDELIVAADEPSITSMTDQILAGREGSAGPIRAPYLEARRLARSGASRPSHEWRSSLITLGADLHSAPSDAILADAGNRIGTDVLSILAHGIPGRRPATISGVLRVLREIENGNAERMGIGVSLQAEGQRVARQLLEQFRNDVKREGIPVEAFRKGLDPAMMDADDLTLARELGRSGVLVYDEADPLGSLQYVFKKAPKKAVVLEWSQVPGLSEEFLAGRYEPFAARVGAHQLRQVARYLFGPRGNEAIGAAVRNQFVDRLSRLGVQPKDAQAVWSRWRDIARASRDTEVRGRRGGLTGRTLREHLPADNPLYADVRNIPSRTLDHDAQEALGLTKGIIGPAVNVADYDPAYLELLRSVDYGTAFREASSPVRRYLKGESIQFGSGPAQKSPLGRTPTLGRALAGTYGLVAHNKAVTTLYHWFRFALDVRYHAMNYLEAQFLYLGRAGLRDGEIATGYLGQSERYLRHLDEDFANNTGYATSRSRFAYAYKTFLKEQPEELRGALGTLEREDPALMQQAVHELATTDPELRDMIAQAGETPDSYLRALDTWHGKMLDTASIDESDAAIAEALAGAIREQPALAEVYGRLADVNKGLWRDIRETFYGNPDRSRAERVLNSYLLFWPISYQIKATKWLLGVMFDRAGGIKTNAIGAYAIGQFAQDHQRLLATDPEYQDWFEKHKTLVFMAQMLAPITPDSIGVSLNPILRDVFFERTKAPWEIGPIYTATLIPKVASEVMTDLYPTLGDLPGFDAIYRMTTGRQAPIKPTAQP